MADRSLRLFRYGLLLTLATGALTPGFAQQPAAPGGAPVSHGLVGVGRLPANLRDKLGETFGSGSSMAFDLSSWRRQGDSYTGTLYLLPDRGYNVDGTTDYSNRLNVLGIDFTPAKEGADATGQNQVRATLQDTIPLTEQNGTPLTGLDPVGGDTPRPAAGGFPVLPKATNGKIALDPEGLVRLRDGSFYVSDEYGPYIYRFSASGKLLAAIRPPEALIPMRNGVQDFSSNNPGPGASAPKPADPVSGRQNNQGLEGLSLAPDGKILYALLQSATRQDGGAGGNSPTRHNTRLLAYDISADLNAPKLIGHYVVQLPRFQEDGKTKVAAQSEILALNAKQLLVLARDSNNGWGVKGSTSLYRSIDLIDVTNATNLVGTPYSDTATPVAPEGNLVANVTPTTYTPFLNIVDNAQLNRFGLHNGAPNDRNNLSEKWEGLGLVSVLDPNAPNDYFLFAINDNDFLTTDGFQVGAAYKAAADVDTTLLVYRLTLPSYVNPLSVAP